MRTQSGKSRAGGNLRRDPNTGYTFGGFSGDCAGPSCALSNVTGLRSVTALFTLNSYAVLIAASPPGGGIVSCAPIQ